MKKVLAVIAAMVIVGGGAYVVLSAKDKDNDSTAKMTASHVSPSSKATSPTPAATDSSVEISDLAFSPTSLIVKKGTMVTWTNKDATAHTVTETDGQNGPKSQELNEGQTYSFTFNTAGTFKYHCTIHPSMTGAVTVTE